MKIGLLQIGPFERETLEYIQKSLTSVFAKTQITIINKITLVAQEAYDSGRKQHYSSFLLMVIKEYARKIDMNKILGVTDADLFVPRLNFVFGEAESPGRAAIVSLHRLRPEFYGEITNQALFLERAAKEATHELGHAFGLPHCPDSLCVMSFSNSIQAVDAKKRDFCPKCLSLLAKTIF